MVFEKKCFIQIKGSVSVKKSVLLFLACSVLLLAACQKTPESVMDGNVLRAKSSNDLLVESLVNAPADNGNQGGTTPVL